MQARIMFLPGDGIGPEVVSAAGRVLAAVGALSGHTFETLEGLIGGCAMDATGVSLPEETLTACREADAVLLGAVGGPKWDDPHAKERPEVGLLALRKNLDLFANLRPVRPFRVLQDASPLKPRLLDGVDLLVVRELTGGIYFGKPRGMRREGDEWQAVDSMVYSESEIRRVAHIAFRLARGRRRKVSSVDKANVLESSRLWRRTVAEVAREYPDVTLENVLVDAAAMFLISRPASFDVLLTGNMFGDILTDEASVLTGSMGNLPSASLGAGMNRYGRPRGLYEPIHGSAPDIAGQEIANPVGTILSVAMLLRHSLGLEAAAAAVENAVAAALQAGCRTRDLAGPGASVLNTNQMAVEIINRLAVPAEIGT